MELVGYEDDETRNYNLYNNSHTCSWQCFLNEVKRRETIKQKELKRKEEGKNKETENNNEDGKNNKVKSKKK